jgi:uncharacterized SAM-binding protein YcdF (DUF218 family)
MRGAPSSARPRIRSALRFLLLCAGLFLLVCLIRWQATLNWFGNFLVDADRLEHADLILVMGGDFWGPRVIKAAELAAQGYAPLALISGPPYRGEPEGERAVEFLVERGYPKRLFAVFGHNEASTFGEVIVLRSELARRHVKRVIVVTSSFHSRRCAILFRLICPGIRFLSAPADDPHYHPEQWWTDPPDRELLFSEWEKIIGSVFLAYPTYRISSWTRSF